VIGPGYDVVLFDLDGTLYRGDATIPGAPAAVARTRGAGARPIFVTNNSSRTQAAVAAHLSRVGIPSEPEEIETSAIVTAQRLVAVGCASHSSSGRRGSSPRWRTPGCEWSAPRHPRLTS